MAKLAGWTRLHSPIPVSTRPRVPKPAPRAHTSSCAGTSSLTPAPAQTPRCHFTPLLNSSHIPTLAIAQFREEERRLDTGTTHWTFLSNFFCSGAVQQELAVNGAEASPEERARAQEKQWALSGTARGAVSELLTSADDLPPPWLCSPSLPLLRQIEPAPPACKNGASPSRLLGTLVPNFTLLWTTGDGIALIARAGLTCFCCKVAFAKVRGRRSLIRCVTSAGSDKWGGSRSQLASWIGSVGNHGGRWILGASRT